MKALATLTTEVFYSDKEGTTSQRDIQVIVLSNGTFVVESGDMDHLKLAPEFESIHELREHFEYKSEVYSRMALAKKGATPMLAVWLSRPKSSYALVRLDYLPVLQLADASLMTPAGVYIQDDPIRLPDTPEARAKLDALMASIRVAHEILQGLETAIDPLRYLMAIEFQKSEPNPELSSKSASDDNPAPEAPAATAVVDDDEL